MKKLSLGKLKLLSEEVIERSQMASIYGGYGGSGDFGTCKAKWQDESDEWIVACGWSKDTVQNLAAQHNGNWCCDNCNSSYDNCS